MKIRVNFRVILLYVCMFLVLLYPFNATLTVQIYGEANKCLFSVVLGIIGLFIFAKKEPFNRKDIILFCLSLIFLLMVTLNNYYWKEGFELKVLLYIAYLFLPYIISKSKDYIRVFCNVIKVFFIEHIVATFIGLFFKDFYKNSILSFVCSTSTHCIASGNYFHGYVPGITTHFSTNAIYLSIASLFLFAEFLAKKKKGSLIFFVVSLIALFVTGKRAHLIFTIFCCFALYFFCKREKKLFSKIFIFLIIAGVGIGLFFVLANYIPELMNIINRFEDLSSKGDLLNGRLDLYNLAFDLWNDKIILGNGWGAFSYFYQIYLYIPNSVSYLDAHNVFLQLLCEVGILGATFTIFIFLYLIVKAYKNIDICKKDKSNSVIIYFCLAYQLFFLLYCLTGNPLYDSQCYVVYFITIGFVLCLGNLRKESKKNEKSRNNDLL